MAACRRVIDGTPKGADGVELEVPGREQPSARRATLFRPLSDPSSDP
jgi:hypothetical protein